MGEPGNTGYGRRTVIKGAALALALSSSTGCWCTVGVWKWAAEPLPRSRATCVTRAPEGGERVLFRLRGCPDRPDGWYSLDIPGGWREQPTHASAWGSDVQEIAEPATSLAPLIRTRRSGRGRGRSANVRRYGLLRLDFRKVAEGWRPPEGSAYGVIHVPQKERYLAEIFGYDGAGGRWVRLGGAGLDPGRRRAARYLLALPATVFPVPIVDMVILQSKVIGKLVGKDVEFVMPRYKSDLPWLVRMLDDPSPARRIEAAMRLRVYGAHGKPAVPALKALISGGDAEVRVEALWTLHALSALDALTLAAMLRSEDVVVRRDAALFLGALKSAEVVPSLIEALRDSDWGVRRDAALALGCLGPEAREAAPALREALEDASEDVRRAAEIALKRLALAHGDSREAPPVSSPPGEI